MVQDEFGVENRVIQAPRMGLIDVPKAVLYVFDLFKCYSDACTGVKGHGETTDVDWCVEVVVEPDFWWIIVQL